MSKYHSHLSIVPGASRGPSPWALGPLSLWLALASPAAAAPATEAAQKSQEQGQPESDEIVELPAEPRGGRPRVDLQLRLEQLEQKNDELNRRIQDLTRRVDIVTNPSTAVRLTGYIDAGFFAFLSGTGSGITNYVARPNVTGATAQERLVSLQADPRYQRFPEFFAPCGLETAGMTPGIRPCPRAPAGLDQTRWRFLGDPLATAINSAGHPADTFAQNNPGQSSLAVPYDYIQSGGRPTFLINELNITPIAKLGEHFQAVASINFYPRSASVSIGDKSDGGSVVPAGPTSTGDYLFADLAFLEYSHAFAGGRHQLSVFAGRFDPNIGIEYRVRKSPDRFGVTPSLLCRYSCGTPIGLKVRARLFDDWFHVALAVHNSASYQEQLFRFAADTDKKYMKTLSGRLALRAPVLGGVEIGLSGEYGGQVDGFYNVGQGEFDPFSAQWTVDVDLHVEWRSFELRAEFLQTHADGFTGSAQKPALPLLDARGVYIEASYRILNTLGVLLRWDFRDALHVDYSVPFAYTSLLWRLALGARFDINDNIAVKAEYLHLQPFGRMAEGLEDNRQVMPTAGDFGGDWITTSLVLKY